MSAAQRVQIIATARDFVFRGVAYVWGGTSRNGTDCSGLVQIAYADAGISLPRTTYEQIKQCRPIQQASVLPGDLIFFTFDGDVHGHVAIWSGNGQMIHEPDQGRVATEEAYTGGWLDHSDGFYRHPALDDAEPPAGAVALVPRTLAVVDADEGLVLRRLPTVNSERITLLPDQTPVLVGYGTATADNHVWRQVGVANPTAIVSGWVASEFLKAG